MELSVGIVGAGIGGLMAAIAIAHAGGKVTILEGASELGEIGAGIQMTPNVARLLMRYGVDKVIGDNLVRFEELNMRRKDGTKVGYTPTSRIEIALGYPWWLVHRHHLHTDLVEVARSSGVAININSRVTELKHENEEGRNVSVTTLSGRNYTFDLLIGADGVGSIVRKTLFPDMTPRPPTGNVAYRAIVPYDEIGADPETRSLVEDAGGNLKKTMDVWMASSGYIISYPISNARDFNMVLSHFRDPPRSAVEEVDIEEVRREYDDYDPVIRKVIQKVQPPISRWPLLVTGPLDSWSSPSKNVVLMGDAAHSMVNIMAQGAATSMEDGAFLARCLRSVIQGTFSLADAITVYETGRMPKSSYKQQVSFLNGYIWHMPDGPEADARDKAMEPELRGDWPLRSSNLYGDPKTVLECYGYDAEAHADEEIAKWLNGKKEVRDVLTTVTKAEADRTVNWFLPEGQTFEVKAKI